jgi:hypothetical protein
LENTEENYEMIWIKCEMIWKKCEMIWKSRLNCEKIGNIWKKPITRAAATRLLENPVEATTIVQNFVLLLVENVV